MDPVSIGILVFFIIGWLFGIACSALWTDNKTKHRRQRTAND